MKNLIHSITIIVLVFSINANAENVKARAYILKDITTNKTILSKNANKYLPPASTTKLMTLYLLFDHIKKGKFTLTQRLKVSKKAWKKGGSKMFLNPNASVRVVDLIKGISVSSGNDASTVVAENIAGSEKAFVKLMNKKAKEFGMKRTHFVNPTGWDNKGHYSTANDLAILAERVIEDFPEFYRVFSLKSFKHNGIRQYNKNTLLGIMGVDGLKTGHVNSVGYNIVSSAKRNGTRYLAVVLGTRSKAKRESETKKLYDFAYKKYKEIELLNPMQDIATTKTYLCNKKYINLGVSESLSIPMTETELKGIRSEIEYYPVLNSPIYENQEVGKIKIYFKGEEIPLTRALVTKDSCSTVPYFERLQKMIMYKLTGKIE